MASIEYSLSALNVLKKFYRADILVFVEGDDDLPFWRAVFSSFCDKIVAVHSLGCSNEVEKYAQRIHGEDANIIVARDADYLRVVGGVINHDRVIYTTGHSIENSLFVPKIISKICQLIHRRDAPDDEVVLEWINHIASELKPLIIIDMAAQLQGVGISILGDNCARYMVSSKSERISSAKVKARLEEVGGDVSAESIASVTDALSGLECSDADLMRGHVLSSAGVRFISRFSKKNASNETVFTNALTIFDSELSRNHPHRDYYRVAVDRAVMSVAD